MEIVKSISSEINKIDSVFDDTLNQLELLMLESPASINPPLIHRFTPGLYIREIQMPEGSLIVSKIHDTEHPFIVSKGKVSVMTEDNEIIIEAPYTGITKPGTRRSLYCHTDVVWTTIHKITDGETVEQIEERILRKNENPYNENKTMLNI